MLIRIRQQLKLHSIFFNELNLFFYLFYEPDALYHSLSNFRFVCAHQFSVFLLFFSFMLYMCMCHAVIAVRNWVYKQKKKTDLLKTWGMKILWHLIINCIKWWWLINKQKMDYFGCTRGKFSFKMNGQKNFNLNKICVCLSVQQYINIYTYTIFNIWQKK